MDEEKVELLVGDSLVVVFFFEFVKKEGEFVEIGGLELIGKLSGRKRDYELFLV